LVFFDPDIQDVPNSDATSVSGVANLQNANAHKKAKINNLNQARLTWVMPKIKEFPWYFVNPRGSGDLARDATLIYQARFNLDVDVVPASSVNTGPIVIDWACEFSDPSTDAGTAAPPAPTSSSRISVFNWNASIAIANSILLLSNTSMSNYYGHGDGAVYLALLGQASLVNYGMRLTNNLTYYCLVALQGVALGNTTISTFTTGPNTPTPSKIHETITSSTTSSQLFFEVDLTDSIRYSMPNNSIAIYLTTSSTSLSSYSVTWFTDPDPYTTIRLSKDQIFEERIKQLENKEYGPRDPSKYAIFKNPKYVDRCCNDKNCRKCILEGKVPMKDIPEMKADRSEEKFTKLAMMTRIDRNRKKFENDELDYDIKDIFPKVFEEKVPFEENSNQRSKRYERTLRLVNYINEISENDLKSFDEEKSDDLVVVTPPGGTSVVTK